MGEYHRINTELGQVIAECRNEMETLNRTVEEQKAEIENLKHDIQTLNKTDSA